MGALTGVGRATALAFAQEGAHLVVSGRREASGPGQVTSSQRTDNTICSSQDGVISEWTLTATLPEPFLAGLMRSVPIRVQGISVVHMQNGKITRWSDTTTS